MIEARVPSASDGRRVAPWWSRGHDRRPAPSRSCEDGSPRHRFIPRSGTQRDPRRRSPLRPAPPSSPQKHGRAIHLGKTNGCTANVRVEGARRSRDRVTGVAMTSRRPALTWWCPYACTERSSDAPSNQVRPLFHVCIKTQKTPLPRPPHQLGSLASPARDTQASTRGKGIICALDLYMVHHARTEHGALPFQSRFCHGSCVPIGAWLVSEWREWNGTRTLARHEPPDEQRRRQTRPGGRS